MNGHQQLQQQQQQQQQTKKMKQENAQMESNVRQQKNEIEEK